MSATIAEALGQRGSAPYSRPLKVRVVARNEPVTYRSKDGEQRQCLNCAVSDGETVTKVAVYDTAKFGKFAEGHSVVLRDIIKKNDDDGSSIVVTKATKVFLSASMEVPEALVREGHQLLNPPPAPTATLQNALRAPQKQRVSITGKVVQEDAVRTVTVKGEDVPIKAIYLSDNSVDRCKVTLWRDITAVDIRPGDYVSVTNVVTNTYKNETTLSATSRTEVQKVEAPVMVSNVTVLGISLEGDSVDMLLDDESIISVEREMLFTAVPGVDNLEHLIEDGPVLLTITRKGSEVLSIQQTDNV